MHYRKSILIVVIIFALSLFSVSCSSKKKDAQLPTGTFPALTGTGGIGDTGTGGTGTGTFTTTSARLSSWDWVPPIGLTFYVAHYSNVDAAFLQTMETTMLEANDLLWDASEGQIFINKIYLTDDLANRSDMDINDVDVLQFYSSDYLGTGFACCNMKGGRCGRRIHTQCGGGSIVHHELGHFLYSPKWMFAQGLCDEYTGMSCTCVMAASGSMAYCKAGNHDAKWDLQPSCQSVLNLTYTNFHWSGTDTGPGPAPAPEVIVTDMP